MESFVDGYEAIMLFGYEAISGSWAMDCEPCRFSATFFVWPPSPNYRSHIGLSDDLALVDYELHSRNLNVGSARTALGNARTLYNR